MSYSIAEGGMRVVQFRDVRKNLQKALDRVVEDADYTIIARRNGRDAVLMSLDMFTSIMETAYLLKSPANAQHLATSIAQYRAGGAKPALTASAPQP